MTNTDDAWFRDTAYHLRWWNDKCGETANNWHSPNAYAAWWSVLPFRWRVPMVAEIAQMRRSSRGRVPIVPTRHGAIPGGRSITVDGER